MVEAYDVKPNGAVGRRCGEGDVALTLYCVLRRLMAEIFFPDPQGKYGLTPVALRVKGSLSENVPLLGEASRNTGRGILLWTRRGSSLRALLVASVGSIVFLTLSGLAIFMLFFLATIISAIIISLLVSLATAGGFLAFFFACTTAIYVGALSLAAFVISTATVLAIIAALITTGWIGFFWAIWLVTKKSMGLAKHSLIATGSALSMYSLTRHARGRRESYKVSV